MKLKSAHVYGFGKLVDEKITFPQSNLVCIYGENEAGKSTLQKFILFVLFGLPPSKRKQFYPKRSSRMGGRLVIEDEEIGEFSIERLDGVRQGKALCTLKNGEEKDEAWLIKRLKGMDKSAYEAIFSFSAKDLEDIQLMEGENLGEVVLTIGLTGYNNLYEIERKIKQEREKLFRPSGSVPVINKQLKELADQEENLLEIKKKLSTYKPKQNRFEKISEEIIELEKNSKDIKTDRDALQKKLYNFQVIYDYFLTKKELSKYPEQLPFLEQGQNRLEEINHQISLLESEEMVFQRNIKRLTEELKSITGKSLPNSSASLLKKTLPLKQDYADLTNQRQKRTVDLAALTNETKRDLSELHIKLDFDELANLSLPFYIEEQWENCKEEVEELGRKRKSIEEQIQALSNQIKELEEKKVETKEMLLSEEKEREVKNRLERNRQLKQEAIRSKERERWEKHCKVRQKISKRTLLISIILALAALGVGFALDRSLFYVIGTVLFILGISQYVFSNQAIKQTENMFQSSIGTHSRGKLLSEEEIERLERTLNKQNKTKEDIRFIEQNIQQKNLELDQTEQSLQTIQIEEDHLDGKLAEQRKEYPFLEWIEVSYWPEVFTRLQRIIEKYKQIVRIENELKEINEQIKLIEDKSLTVYQEIFEDEDKSFTPDIFEQFTRRLEEENHLQIEKGEKEKLIYQNEEELSSLKTKKEHFIREKTDLFKQAEVETEDAFYERAEQYDKKKQLIERLDKLTSQLSLSFTEEELQKIDLTTFREDLLQERLAEYNDEIHKLDELIGRKREERSELLAELRHLETSEDYSEAVHQFALEKGSLMKNAKGWAVLKVAEDALLSAKRSYHQKYVLEVIKGTEQIFKQITDGNYVQIFPPSVNEPFTVQSKEGVMFEIDELSQGTIEQLYVSLKLAFGQLISDEHQVPFMIDDAFVHFDEKRLSRMLDIVTELSEQKQILLFTCKREVIDRIDDKHILRLKGVEVY